MVLSFGLLALSCSRRLAWPRVKGSIRAEFPKVSQLAANDLAAWLDDPKRTPPLLLDVRQAEEYEVSHLPRAIHVSPETTDFTFLEERRNDPIVVYCSVGYRSSRLAKRLQEAGFSDVANLEGSIFEWANQGRPLERENTPADKVHPFNRIWGRLLDESRRAPL